TGDVIPAAKQHPPSLFDDRAEENKSPKSE
ncbi:hypothetical protein A2U01_0117533, partial [Trifolium medium]|nr:hypothetical protein [Trifolium medium]